jgi:hypothetical protein
MPENKIKAPREKEVRKPGRQTDNTVIVQLRCLYSQTTLYVGDEKGINTTVSSVSLSYPNFSPRSRV